MPIHTTSMSTLSCLLSDVARATSGMDSSGCNPCAAVARELSVEHFDGIVTKALALRDTGPGHQDILCYDIRVLRNGRPLSSPAARNDEFVLVPGAPVVSIDTVLLHDDSIKIVSIVVDK